MWPIIRFLFCYFTCFAKSLRFCVSRRQLGSTAAVQRSDSKKNIASWSICSVSLLLLDLNTRIAATGPIHSMIGILPHSDQNLLCKKYVVWHDTYSQDLSINLCVHAIPRILYRADLGHYGAACQSWEGHVAQQQSVYSGLTIAHNT
jgi:hypothetical protein